MFLKDRLSEDMKNAMRAKAQDQLTTIRMVLAAIKQKEIDERIVLDNVTIIAVIEKMIKQRKDAAAQYLAGNRPELAAKEEMEVVWLQAYLPQALTPAEIEALIDQVIAAQGAIGVGQLGKVISELKPKLAGRADMSKVSALVKTKLTA